MLKIKIQDVDELNSISTELEVIAYLQSLVRYDFKCDTIKSPDFKNAYDHAKYYLHDRQLDAVLRLRYVLSKEDFLR